MHFFEVTAEDEEMKDIDEANLDKQETKKVVSGRAPAASSKSTMQHSKETLEDEDQAMEDIPGETITGSEEKEREANERDHEAMVHVQRNPPYGIETSSYMDNGPTEGLPADQVSLYCYEELRANQACLCIAQQSV